jgi:predicted mannosyl-3-phosphoglycerate phosphatase (HAD superfamily)
VSIFSNIFSVFRSEDKSDKYAELSVTLASLRAELDKLEKTVEDQNAMILYLSTIQSDLAAECFTVSDTLRKLTAPKKATVRFISSSSDDDDLIN